MMFYPTADSGETFLLRDDGHACRHRPLRINQTSSRRRRGVPQPETAPLCRFAAPVRRGVPQPETAPLCRFATPPLRGDLIGRPKTLIFYPVYREAYLPIRRAGLYVPPQNDGR